ncbi:ProQ/FinO family protein [Sodalis endosymbiont of Spalangia cameroni]|uniref:ProQ/FinO family protein n=1 Tax=Sodalis praecaptivus TaxID=1239307 RepID=UPI0031F75E59
MTKQKRSTLSIKGKPTMLVPPSSVKKTDLASEQTVVKTSSKEGETAKAPPKSQTKAKQAAKRGAKNQRRGQASIATLMALWPEAFNEASPKPLKIGILSDMLHEATSKGLDISRKQIRTGVMVYSRTKAYQDALCEGGARFDLRGQPNGEVTEEQRNHALKKRERSNLLSKSE